MYNCIDFNGFSIFAICVFGFEKTTSKVGSYSFKKKDMTLPC